MDRTPPILIISEDPSVIRLSPRLQSEGMVTSVTASASGLREFVSRSAVFIAVLDEELRRAEILEIRRLLRQYGVPVLTLIREDANDGVVSDHEGFSSADQVALKPVKLDELVLRVKALILNAGYDLPEMHPGDAGPGELKNSQERSTQGAIVAVFSAKGGVGKSTIAANLAVGLSQFHGLRSVLVDADLWFGDVSSLLGIDSGSTLAELCSGGEPDATALLETAVRHKSGAMVLQRPAELVAAEKIDIESLSMTLYLARTLFDFVVVDMGTLLDDMTLRLLDVADTILLVATPEISAITNSSRFLHIAETLGYVPKVLLVVNRANSGVDLQALKGALQSSVAATVVSDGPWAVYCANQGVPIVSLDDGEQHKITSDLAAIVDLVAGRSRARREPQTRNTLHA